MAVETFHTLIALNKRNSVLLVFLFTLFFVALGLLIGYVWGGNWPFAAGVAGIAAAVAFVLLVMWLRDNVERQADLRKLQVSVSRLTEQDVPWQWPEGFVSAAARTEALGSPSEQMVVLAYQAVPRRLVLLPDGHAVAVWIHSQMQARWMTRDQLARQLRRQGLSLPDRTEAGDAETPQATQPSD